MGIRFAALVRKEFLQFFRDRFVIILVAYAFMVDAVLMGYSLALKPEHLALGILDQDRSQRSSQLIQQLSATRYLDLAYWASSGREINMLLDQGKVDVGVVIPSSFSRQIDLGQPVRVQVLVDGTNSVVASIGANYASAIILRHSRQVLIERSAIAPSQVAALPAIVGRVRVWYNPGLDATIYMALSGVLLDLMFIAIVIPAVAVVRERVAGTIEQLLVAPIRPIELLAAKMLPMAAVILTGFVISLLEVVLIFGVPLQGSLLLFLAATVLFLFAAFGIGLSISSIAQNLQQALLASFFLVIPMVFLSGTMTPVDSMPALMQYMSYISPLRYFTDIGVGIFFKGVGLAALWPHFLALFGFGSLLLAFSAQRLGRRLT